MGDSKQDNSLEQGSVDSIPGVHRYSRHAMATTFQVIVQHDDAVYARQAAEAAFDEVDRLELELSRFVENSDISRINYLKAGQSERVSLDVFDCLKISSRVYEQTSGAFDVTVGSLLRCWRDEDKRPRTPSEDELRRAMSRTGMRLIELDESRYSVRLAVSGVEVDLGGVGKGYALDKMAELLREWGVDKALIHGGFSSVLALDGPDPGASDSDGEALRGWPVTFSNPANRREKLAFFGLEKRAMSGSGVQKGRHIIDPRTGRAIKGTNAAWVCTADAGTADALSTAFMVMSPKEVEQYCRRHRDVLAMIVVEETDGGVTREKVLHFGPWLKGQLLIEGPYIGGGEGR